MRLPYRSALLGMALTPLALQVTDPPPVSSQLPEEKEETRARQEVVPPAASAAEQEALALPQVYEGRLIQADQQTRTLSVATEEGPKRIQLSPDASVKLNGRQVDNLSQLPEGQDVRAAYRVTPNTETLDLQVIEQPNGPQVSPPRNQGSPSIPP